MRQQNFRKSSGGVGRISRYVLTRMRWIVLVLCMSAGATSANDWDAFSQPGAIGIMRHALAPGTGDPANLVIGECATQRNLDARGQNQARAIGAALRERNIRFDVVLTSQWCRTRETADLLDLGPVVEAPVLNSFFRDFSTRDQQTKAAQDLIASTDGRLMLVTHQVNISATTQRSFYLSPSEDHKVGENGYHLLVGFEIERRGNLFTPVAFEMVDLYGLDCDMKAEFNSDNRRLYEPDRLLARERV